MYRTAFRDFTAVAIVLLFVIVVFYGCEVFRSQRARYIGYSASTVLLGSLLVASTIVFIVRISRDSEERFDYIPPPINIANPVDLQLTHVMRISVIPRYQRLRPGDSVPLECDAAFGDFRAQTKMPKDAIVLALDRSHEYAASASFKAATPMPDTTIHRVKTRPSRFI